MGYNTTLLVLNDALGYIEDDPTFGKKVARAAMSVTLGKPVDISSGGHANAATVIESHHADETNVIAIGGNYGTVLHRTYGYKHHDTDFKERLVREMAKELGFTLQKIRSKKG